MESGSHRLSQIHVKSKAAGGLPAVTLPQSASPDAWKEAVRLQAPWERPQRASDQTDPQPSLPGALAGVQA